MMLKYYISHCLSTRKNAIRRNYSYLNEVFFMLSQLYFLYQLPSCIIVKIIQAYRLISDDTVKAEYQILIYTVHTQQHFCRVVLCNINETHMLIFNQFAWNRKLV